MNVDVQVSESVFSITLCIYLEVELLDYAVTLCV